MPSSSGNHYRGLADTILAEVTEIREEIKELSASDPTDKAGKIKHWRGIEEEKLKKSKEYLAQADRYQG